ncbi:MAG: hypothetical protein D3926_23790 [Desulfobacteraceae bacterium]|nr:MAG: hypothetical protein D3926_23790 [Desulfobacteraceae bacterium]
MKQAASVVGVITLLIYLTLYIFPIKAFYRFDKLPLTPYKSGSLQMTEIPKSFFLLPGKRSLWAVRTSEGYNIIGRFKPASARSMARISTH